MILAKGISLGQVSDSKELVDLDYGTIIGAMEYICAYAKEKWNCPVMFYTNSYLDEGYIKNYMNKTNTPDNQFDSIKNTYIDSYQKMITAMYSIQEKWGFTVVDLWNNDKFKNLNYEIKDYMMADIIHPYKAGYLALYTPEIQAGLYNIFSKETNEVVNEETPKIEEKDSVKTGDDKNIIYMLLSLVVTASVIGCLNKRKIYD